MDKCNNSGGQCDACAVDGSSAYCCHNNLSSDNLAQNGNCPPDAINSMAGSIDSKYESPYHVCVRKTRKGKVESFIYFF